MRRNHNTSCHACSRRPCCCRKPSPPQSSCICPPGPEGPPGLPGSTGPRGLQGLPGSCGPCPSGSSIEKWSGVFTIEADLTIGPGERVCVYLADAVLGALSGAALTSTILLPNLTVPPNYPSTPDGITFDALSVSLKSAIGLAINVPPDGVVLVELVKNAGLPGETVCLSIPFSNPAGLLIPLVGAPGAPLTDGVEGLCFIEPTSYYDVRVCILNTDIDSDIIFGPQDLFLQAAVTGRIISA